MYCYIDAVMGKSGLYAGMQAGSMGGAHNEPITM